jgi:hypothetical protein
MIKFKRFIGKIMLAVANPIEITSITNMALEEE